MKRYIALIAILCLATSTLCLADTASSWPSKWQATFTEKLGMPLRGEETVTGTFAYDANNRMLRVDRSNGNLDRYCGTIFKFTNTPCNQIVRDGKRYFFFPEKKYCCMCCSRSDGCDIINKEFPTHGKFEKRDDIVSGDQKLIKVVIKGL